MANALRNGNPPATPATGRRNRLVRRYFLVFATLVGGALIISVLVEMGFRYQETRSHLEIEHRQMADLAALRIQTYIEDIAQAVRLAGQPRKITDGRLADDYLTDLHTLLKNVPAIRDVFAIGLDGHEFIRLSRIGASLPHQQMDHAKAPYFTAARAGQTSFGPVSFPEDSFEPRIVIAVPIEPFRGEVLGVLAAEVNVRYVWDVIQEIHIGESGYAYIVSGNGNLVAHPDLHLVLQRFDVTDQPQVAALRHADLRTGGTGVYRNLDGRFVLVSHKAIPSVGWTVMVEWPLTEAYRPLMASLARTGGILFVVCIMVVGAAVMLGRRVVRPIEVLRRGATRLEAEEFGPRLELKTGDEFEELADDFNRMAGRVRNAYAGLEQKVEERTQALKQSLDEVKGLGDTIRAVSASLDLQKVLQTIVVNATELSRSDGGLIYEFDEVQQVFRFRAGHLLSPIFVEALEKGPPTLRDSIVGRAAMKGAPEQISDVVADPSYALKDQLLAEGYRSLLAIPTIQAGRLVGGIVVGRRKVGGFSEREIELLQTFANGTTIAIENAHLFLELEQKNAALQQASQHKTQFLANMSHELRTPLNAVIGYTDLILDDTYGEPPSRMRRVVERVQKNGHHLLSLINDVLDLAKIEAGQLSLSLADYSMNEVVSGVIVAVSSLAEKKGLALKADVTPNLPTAHGDDRRIAQALLNLIGNAIKFTDTGEVAVSASARNGKFLVAVRDSGPGIDHADQAKIFGEFQQADGSSTRKKGGTGLGLSITKWIVETHGGRIWVDSSPGKGATFYFTIPIKVGQQEACHEQAHFGGGGSGGQSADSLRSSDQSGIRGRAGDGWTSSPRRGDRAATRSDLDGHSTAVA
jgi:signal transduction histidine kinase